MLKVCVLLALAAAGAMAQEAAAPNEAAAEPYSYAYTADSHAASEQRDPQGRVTGFYTLVGDDGRERRVEYIADEAGFRAKVATNEVGTKSENPADVEVNASEPTAQQLAAVYQAPAVVPQVQYQAPRLVQQTGAQRVTTVQQPLRSQQVAYAYQQPQYAYGYTGNTGYYTNGYYSAPGYAYANNGYNYGYNGGLLSLGNYNNHLPSQYYRSVSTASPAGYTVSGLNSGYRYVNQPAVAGVRTVGYTGTTGLVTGRPSNLQGSSNYLVIQKRAADEKKKN